MEENNKLLNFIDIKSDIEENILKIAKKHKVITLNDLLNYFSPINFREKTGLKNVNQKLEEKYVLVCCVEEIIRVIENYDSGILKNDNTFYLYNGKYWQEILKPEVELFLARATELMGVNIFDAKYYQFRKKLFEQFNCLVPTIQIQKPSDSVNVNFLNGTFTVSLDKQTLKAFDKNDFLTYQLPFKFNPSAEAIIFKNYLNVVLPDIDCQKVLAECIASVFLPKEVVKLEKVALLYGKGANGKSVFFEIVNALLGIHNVTNYSLYNLTIDKNYCRAKISKKLLNYSSEISGKMDSSVFKQLVSGEPIEARLPYHEPFIMRDYAKLIFNCNELPKDVELNNAYFRRFLIIPFDVLIPDEKQDKELSKKIIDRELPGVFNWVLDGLNRLVQQKDFSNCELIQNQVKRYKIESDSVKLFLSEENYQLSNNDMPLKDLVTDYHQYCVDNGFRTLSNRKFIDQLRDEGYDIRRKNFGNSIFIEKKF
ncbi:DNA primase family protein [Emticicia agri]|uniref:DNA primase n=1 Tax=Emticicia agri TaxID=2492393 RepID=A0A4Q5LX72_9BACT|nr:phage/plasmid primase, P4 family [Emticicia agri]RYU94344.1 DNA primase [Emticicia agri]